MTKEERTELFTKIKDLVSTKFFLPDFGGKDWSAIAERHRGSIIAASTDEEFENEVGDLLRELKSPALGLLSSRTKISSRNSINASFRAVQTAIEGLRWVAQDVLPGGVAATAGLRPGDAVISMNGVELFPPTALEFSMGSSFELVVSRNGERSKMTVAINTPKPRYRANPYAEPESVVTSESGGIGLVKISLFPGLLGIDFANKVNAAFRRLDAVERLIIDLRGNPGGGVGGLRVMSHLIAEKEPVGYSLDRRTAERGYDREKLPRFTRIPSSKLEVPFLAVKFGRKKSVVLVTEGLGARRRRRTVVLVNEHTTGAAEMVTLFAREQSIGSIVGSRTPGRLVAREGFKLGRGYTLVVPVAAYVSWRGTRIEGKGIEPDHLVDWSYDAAIAGKDNQLEAAREVVKGL